MDQLGITVFDVAVIAVAVFGAAMGLSAGFAHGVLFIFAWLASAWLASNFSHTIKPEVEKLVGSPELAFFISILVVFVAALVVLIMLANALSRSIHLSPLRRPDRILGAGFGVLCAWVILGTGFLMYRYLGPRELPDPIKNGQTLPMIQQMADFVEPHLPPGFRTRLARPGQENNVTPAPAEPQTQPAPPRQQ
ncbi:MAG TPA: CvpA family protein [Reyranellaceae bacterium]|nr:CvpA family protein [Reyranellaceae bacterium]